MTILAPVFTGGSIIAGPWFTLYIDQDATGSRAAPTYTGGAGAFAADDGLAQVDGTPSGRSALRFTLPRLRLGPRFTPFGSRYRMRLALILLAAIAPAFGQTYNIITVAPNPAASAVGRLRFSEKSNAATRHYLQIEGPDTLGRTCATSSTGRRLPGACRSARRPAASTRSRLVAVSPGRWSSPAARRRLQIDSTGLGAAFQINGSSTTNGNIVINPGNVAGAAVVVRERVAARLAGVDLAEQDGNDDERRVRSVRFGGSGAGPHHRFANAYRALVHLSRPAENALGLAGPSLVVQDVVGSLSDPTNGSGITMAATPCSGGADISVFKTGTGTLLPLRFFRNPNELARFDTNNNFLIGRTTDDGTSVAQCQVAGQTSIGGALIPAFTTTYQLGTASKVWSHTWTSDLTGSAHLILTGVGSPQIDATGTGAALNINGSSTTNGNIVLNPGRVTGLQSVQINGANNSSVLTEALIINDVGGATGSGITMKHGGTFDAAWQSGTSASFDVVGNASTHLFVLDQSGIATRYDALATAGIGVVPVYAVVSSTGVSGSVGTTSLLVAGGTAPAGIYRVAVYLSTRTTGASGFVQVNYGWTDGGIARTPIVSGLGIAVSNATFFNSQVFHTDGSANITISTTDPGTGGTYDIYVTLERLK